MNTSHKLSLTMAMLPGRLDNLLSALSPWVAAAEGPTLTSTEEVGEGGGPACSHRQFDVA